MELARMTSKGQLTVPIAIRKLLGVSAGDQLIFYEKDGQVIIAGANPYSLQQAQSVMAQDHIYTLSQIRQIVSAVAASHGVTSLRLFGSYARGEATAKSDLDFIVSGEAASSLFRLGGLQAALSDAFHKRVDLLAENSLSPDFLSAIAADEVTVYEHP